VPTIEALQNAIERATRFARETSEPHALLWLAVMHERFGVAELGDALQRYDRALAEKPAEAPLLRVLRRFADRENPLRPDDWDAVTNPSDRILVSALYCDRIGLPPSFSETLRKAATAGSYYLPHIVLTWVRIRENGCQLALPSGFMDAVFKANAAIIDSPPAIVSDLRLEAAAFLHLAGQGARVDHAFVDRVVSSQKGDGGWGDAKDGKGGSDWHSTTLGLLLLLHVKSHAEAAAST
jgi:hypothetical protein